MQSITLIVQFGDFCKIQEWKTVQLILNCTIQEKNARCLFGINEWWYNYIENLYANVVCRFLYNQIYVYLKDFILFKISAVVHYLLVLPVLLRYLTTVWHHHPSTIPVLLHQMVGLVTQQVHHGVLLRQTRPHTSKSS